MKSSKSMDLLDFILNSYYYMPILFKHKGFTLTQTCPISFNLIDSNFIRIIAAQVISIALLLIVTQELIFALILFFDFSVRILNLKQLSILAYVAQFIIKNFEIKVQLCDEAPKRFALYMGLVISLIMVVLFAAGFTTFATFIAIILLICALLETAFDFCIGCKIYYGLIVCKELIRK